MRKPRRASAVLGVLVSVLCLLEAACDEDYDGMGGLIGEQRFVLNPREGDVFTWGEWCRIAWVGLRADRVYVTYSTDGGWSWQPVDPYSPVPVDVWNDGWCDWSIPPVDSDSCIVRITPHGYPESEVYSGSFSIWSSAVSALGGAERVCSVDSHADDTGGDGPRNDGRFALLRSPRDHSPAARPWGDLVASSLLAASEGDWRRDIDVGPMEFDEGGIPVTAKPGAGAIPAKARKARRFGVRIGATVELNLQDDEMGVSPEPDGPIGGLSFSIGPRAGRFALELGYDIFSARGWYPAGIEFKSTTQSARLDLVLLLSGPASPARFYLLGGIRDMHENVEIFGPYGNDIPLVNAAEGYAGGVGFLFNRFDLRLEHVEVDSVENNVGITHVTMAFRF